MKTLERGQDKIKKICDTLRKETLEPAEKEAFDIIEAAKTRAAEIIEEAEQHTKGMVSTARKQIEQERVVFQSSLQQAIKQSLEVLRQAIEHDLFHKELQNVIQKHTSDPIVVAKIIEAIVSAIMKEGVSTEISAIIPKTVSAKEVTSLLSENILKRLKNEPAALGSFSGGVQVKLEGKNMTLDITDSTLKELLSNFIRKDFRKLFFSGV